MTCERILALLNGMNVMISEAAGRATADRQAGDLPRRGTKLF